MDPSFMSSQIQSTFMQLIMDLLGKVDKKESYNPVEKWIYEGSGASQANWVNAGGDFSELIAQAAAKYHVDPNLIESVIRAESNFNPSAISSAGAQGLMQLMPATAASLGVTSPFDPQDNIDGGVRLLSQLLNSYSGNLSLTLAAYNAGPGAVAKYGGVPPYKETQTYVSRVLAFMGSGYDRKY